jgi:hypothetical protein
MRFFIRPIPIRSHTMTQPNDEGARNEDLERVSGELVGRLDGLGIRVSGDESPEDLLALVEAVDRFEAAVESRGGDLMVDEGPRGHTTQPDDRHFALPRRRDDESIAEYLARLASATQAVRHHRHID